MIISSQKTREETRHNQTEVFEKATAGAATQADPRRSSRHSCTVKVANNPLATDRKPRKGKSPSKFHVNTSGRYILDHDTNSERIWLTGIWVVRGSTIFLPPMLPHLSAQLGGCEDTEILKRCHLLRDTRAGLTLALRVLSLGEVGHDARGAWIVTG
jgi:hypothetical protein